MKRKMLVVATILALSTFSGGVAQAAPFITGNQWYLGDGDTYTFTEAKTFENTVAGVFGGSTLQADKGLHLDKESNLFVSEAAKVQIKGGLAISGESLVYITDGSTLNADTIQIGKDSGLQVTNEQEPTREAGKVTIDQDLVSNGVLNIIKGGTLIVNGNMDLKDSSYTDVDEKGSVLVKGNWKQGTGSYSIFDKNAKVEIDGNMSMDSEVDVHKGSSLSIKGNLVQNAELDVRDGSSLEVSGDIASSQNIYITRDSKANLHGKVMVNKSLHVTDGSELTITNEVHVIGDSASIFMQNGGVTRIANGAALYSDDNRLQAVSVGKDSELIFDAGSSAHVSANEDHYINTIAYVKENGRVSIDPDANLFVTNAEKNEKYNYTNIITVVGQDAIAWAGKMYGSTLRQKLTPIEGEDGWGIIESTDLDLDGVQALPTFNESLLDKDNTKLSDFLDSATSTADGEASIARATHALNSLSSMTGLAGVGYGDYTFTNSMNDMVRQHADSKLWANYLHKNTTASGLDAGALGADYKLTYNGFLIGSDFYQTDKFTIGAAFGYASGSTKSRNSAVATKNDTDYYGGTIYAKMDAGNDLTYKAELGYNRSSNDIGQTNSGSAIKGKTNGSSFHVGVSAEKVIARGENDSWVPFAGLYYMHLSADDYTDSLGFCHAPGSANVWSMPLGVKYTHETVSGDWKYKPYATVGYRLAFGNRKMNETFSYNGVGTSFQNEIAQNAFFGALGVEAEKDNLSFGISYGYEKGSDTRSNAWGVNCSYKF